MERVVVDQIDNAHDGWEKARRLAAQWIRLDTSSPEAQALSTGAVKLLQALIFEESVSNEARPASADTCRQLLQAEIETPGYLLERLKASTDPRVAAVAHWITDSGRTWVVTIGPSNNAVVMTALLNLPNVAQW